ncbi:hypothetical protein ACFC09_40385 [Streptomyces sp. NPDC056161]|uniref:BACON domain-containing protein n=1 Tax=Streptomyces sp. NPDC056161 TaxID=3345732 RepID=UPI0035DC43FC
MNSSPETSTRTTGAHRAHREARDRSAARTLAHRPPTRHEPYLDGLFTYCLSVLCDHDTATAALGDALALAERRGHRGPEPAEDRRSWLYALARWACLRKLTEAKQKHPATHASGRPGPGTRPATGAQPGPGTEAGPGTGTPPGPGSGTPPGAARRPDPQAADAPPTEEARQRRRELALLAWPEAAGTTPEQREALELAVRHHLSAQEIAAVLGMDQAAARDLLASAACEVERTRAALAVVETGGCPGVARLAGDHRLVLSSTVRRELVRHVDDCPRCRRTAERAVPGRWPGAAVTPTELPVLTAPRAALRHALAHHPRARGTAVPRFDRRGFPMDPKDRAARRDRLRARAVTTTVVATVVAAPVLALWAAHRGAPAGEGDGPTATAREARDEGGLRGEMTGGYENTGDTGTRSGARFLDDRTPDVSVEVVSVSGAGRKDAGHLTVSARGSGETTLVTLTADGPAPVRWSASTAAGWLWLSRGSGTLRPGESLTIKVHVDRLREPSGYWTARIAVAPAGAVVSIRGYGSAPTRPSDPGGRPTTGTPGPTPATSAPTAPPTSPTPSPTPTSAAPSEPPHSTRPSSPPPPADTTDPGPSDG